MTGEARPRVLCVDDDANILEGLESHLRRLYDVTCAASGAAALAVLEEAGPFAVVLSDMRMPGMDGAAFLAQVRQREPDTVRMLLTGQTDLKGAIAAVNDGQIVRFLTKPCSPKVLLDAFAAAVAQHRLIIAERELLEQTLRGCIAALLDVLALSSPIAFGRAVRLKQYALQMATKLQVADAWKIEVAAMLSQIGCISLPPDTSERLYEGRPLSASEQAMVAQLPRHAQRLIAHIPRMEEISRMLACQQRRYDGGDGLADLPVGLDIPVGARIIKIAHDYDVLITQAVQPPDALAVMKGRAGWYDPRLLLQFGEQRSLRDEDHLVYRITLEELRPGMELASDLRSPAGVLLVARGYEVTAGLLVRLRNYPAASWPQEVLVRAPPDWTPRPAR